MIRNAWEFYLTLLDTFLSWATRPIDEIELRDIHDEDKAEAQLW